jgi:hypothetical protein
LKEENGFVEIRPETSSRAREQVRSDLIGFMFARLWPLEHRHGDFTYLASCREPFAAKTQV